MRPSVVAIRSGTWCFSEVPFTGNALSRGNACAHQAVSKCNHSMVPVICSYYCSDCFCARSCSFFIASGAVRLDATVGQFGWMQLRSQVGEQRCWAAQFQFFCGDWKCSCNISYGKLDLTIGVTTVAASTRAHTRNNPRFGQSRSQPTLELTRETTTGIANLTPHIQGHHCRSRHLRLQQN